MFARDDRESTGVAIIGAGCRLPGADGPEEFWDVLAEGRSTVGTIPSDRFDVEPWYSPEPGAPDTIRSRRGGFLDGIDEFDAEFFDVVPDEADQLDPQQRLLLETAWQAIDDAGQTASGLAGSATGVYVSVARSGYEDRLRAAGRLGMHAMMGAETGGVTAGRLAYHLDARGPAMSVGASCATGLAALHVAVRALRTGEIDLAVVGGANLILSPHMHLALSSAEVLSPDGVCRFGDVAADGFVRSEGVVALVLKRAADARRDGDRSYATILSTVVRGSGRSGETLTSLGANAQEAALRAAYADAAVDPAEVRFVEAHGPGTASGDPVEIAALASVMSGRATNDPCLIGSVKTNIGHCEIAAGLAGVLKAALALQHRSVPATLNIEHPQPLLRDRDVPVRAPETLTALPAQGRLVAGVSSFGLTGAMGHAVLAAAPDPEPRSPEPAEAGLAYLLPVSAASRQALRALAARMADRVEAEDGPRTADLCHTAALRRTHHRVRAAVVGGDRAELAAELRRLAGPGPAGRGPRDRGRPRVAFVFPGHGTRDLELGRALLWSDPTFTEVFERCATAVRDELGWSPAEVAEGLALSRIDEVHPATWAVQVALAATLRAWGLEPDVVVGHSMGEISAAVVAGALTVADGAKVVCRRARLLTEDAPDGAMCAVALGDDAARAAVGERSDRVHIGSVNGPHATVLSGEPDAVSAVVASLRERNVPHRWLPVRCASHSPLMGPLSRAVESAVADVRPRAGAVPLHSTVVDDVVHGGTLDGRYWADNLRLPVRFADAVGSLLEQDPRTLFVEVSAAPTLLPAIEDGVAAAGAEAGVCAVSDPGRPSRSAMLDVAAIAYAQGCALDWERLGPPGRSVPLPSYPWQRRRFGVPARHPAARPTRAEVIPFDRGVAEPRVDGLDPAAVDGRPSSRAACLTDLLRRASAVLGVGPDDLDHDASPLDLGLSSLFATKLAHDVRSGTGIDLSGREVTAATSLRSLATEIHHRLGGGPGVMVRTG